MKHSYWFISVALFLNSCASLPTTANKIALESGEVRFTKPIKTWKELLQQHIVMQRHDYSCGAASLATLLRYYFQEEVTETEVMGEITSHLTASELANRQHQGFSLLDLKEFAERRGYQAVGVRLKWSALPKLRGPILVYLHTPETEHFAILRGVRENQAFLADPSRGNLRMSVTEFAKEWGGVALVLGKEGFGTPSNYPLAITDEELGNKVRAARKGLYTNLSRK